MKKLLTFVLLATVCIGTDVFAQQVQPERKARPRRRSAAQVGGILVKPGTGIGTVKFINCQDKIDDAFLKETVKGIATFLSINLEVVPSDGSAFDMTKIAEEKAKFNAQELIYLVNDKSLPMSLMAIEDGYALINFAALATDASDAGALKNRVQRQIWRIFGLMNGASNTIFPHCVLKSVHNVKDIDKLGANVMCPEPYSKICDDLRARGVLPRVMATYRQACNEGWAPEPTNEVQRAIWKEVHTLPTDPIKIKFDPKHDK